MDMSQTSVKPSKLTSAKKEAAGEKPSKFVILIPVILLALVALAAFLLLVLPSLGGEQSNPQKLMQKYYQNLYAGDIRKLPECLPEELREAFEQVSTMGGASSSIYLSYRQQMEEEIGGNIQVKVELTGNENAGSEKLNSTQKDFSGATTVNLVEFDVVLTGDTGSVTLSGVTYVAKIGSQWYLTTYNLLLDRTA